MNRLFFLEATDNNPLLVHIATLHARNKINELQTAKETQSPGEGWVIQDIQFHFNDEKTLFEDTLYGLPEDTKKVCKKFSKINDGNNAMFN